MNTLRKTLTSLTLTLAASGLVSLPLAARQSGQGRAKAKPAAEAKSHGRRASHAAPFTGVVNINNASAEQFDRLPRVGPKVAQRIVDYRQAHGPFKKVEELMNVKGIGEKTFLKIKGNLTI